MILKFNYYKEKYYIKYKINAKQNQNSINQINLIIE